MLYLGSYNLQLLDHFLRFVRPNMFWCSEWLQRCPLFSRNLWVLDSFALQYDVNQLIFHSSNNKYHGIECSDGNLPGYWYRKFSVTPQFQVCEKIFVKDAKKDTAATNSYWTGRGNWSFVLMCFRRKWRAKSDSWSPVSRLMHTFIGACLFVL